LQYLTGIKGRELMALIDSIVENSKKLGRITALVIILGVAGAISLIMINDNMVDADALYGSWLDLAKIAIMFYFSATITKSK